MQPPSLSDSEEGSEREAGFSYSQSPGTSVLSQVPKAGDWRQEEECQGSSCLLQGEKKIGTERKASLNSELNQDRMSDLLARSASK